MSRKKSKTPKLDALVREAESMARTKKALDSIYQAVGEGPVQTAAGFALGALLPGSTGALVAADAAQRFVKGVAAKYEANREGDAETRIAAATLPPSARAYAAELVERRQWASQAGEEVRARARLIMPNDEGAYRLVHWLATREGLGLALDWSAYYSAREVEEIQARLSR